MIPGSETVKDIILIISCIINITVFIIIWVINRKTHIAELKYTFPIFLTIEVRANKEKSLGFLNNKIAELKKKHKDEKLTFAMALVFLLMVIAFTNVDKLDNKETNIIDKNIQE